MSVPPALPVRRLPRTLRHFLETEAAGGLVLLVAALAALAWANSPWRDGYDQLWATELSLRVGPFAIAEDLRHWINDAAMALFFFVVGLEIKRELVKGDLREPRAAVLPAIAALGGMVVPALLYLAVTAGGPGARGWGIPMATDIAFAVGVLALLGPRVPGSLRLFLLTLAIVDDIGAILVIAVFYAEDLDGGALLVALALLAAVVALRRIGVVWFPAYVLLGLGVWLATYLSGVHATIAGVALGLVTPARPLAPTAVAREWAEELDDDPSAGDMAAMTALAKATVSVAERLQHTLHPWTSFLIVPLFALANAGVALGGGALDAPGSLAIAAGIALGLVVGKTVGITGAVWLAVRLHVGRLPEGATWGRVTGVAAVAGIGFTVSLFVAGLAFEPGSPAEDAAKLAILAASLTAAVLGVAVLRFAHPSDRA